MIIKENGFYYRTVQVSLKKNKLAEVYYYFLKSVLRSATL